MKVDDINDCIMTHGWGTLFAKFDLESAYRIIPEHSHDRYLLGVNLAKSSQTCLSRFENTIMK